ncbi:hypothetical protein HDK77DRAFT_437949 [Phyllosticta capitalensis]
MALPSAGWRVLAMPAPAAALLVESAPGKRSSETLLRGDECMVESPSASAAQRLECGSLLFFALRGRAGDRPSEDGGGRGGSERAACEQHVPDILEDSAAVFGRLEGGDG